ncbi:hypothetical protein [Micromonospora tarensis]|uniref:hypothetical protein n=1 Tax=Micromonospora tarensis TaxID=2806100 RepID=UPI002814D1D2|nr:hypothetical protein [Micromonospora tarensis]
MRRGRRGLVLADGVALLRPEEQVFVAMCDGWRAQQLARNLAFATIDKRLQVVRAFAAHADAYPWQWRPQLLDDWLADLRAVRGRRRSTIRNYSATVAAFCDYLTDPAYEWAAECERRFGSHPVQVVHEWNTAVHVQDAEGDRRGGRSRWMSCRRCSTTPTSRWCAPGRRDARAGWRCSETPRCSRLPTPTGCVAGRW